MWGDDLGGRDMSHLYLGMAMGSVNRARKAEKNVDEIYYALGHAHASTISWRSISIAYQQLCEAMLDELADSPKPRELTNPCRPEARNLFLRHAVSEALKAAAEKNKSNGNSKQWPHMLDKAQSQASLTILDIVNRMDTHANAHFELHSGRVPKK